MRRAARRDTHHAAIARELIALGFSVADTASLGKAFPDLVIGKHGVTALVEVKTHDRAKNGVKSAKDLLSEGQKTFGDSWRGSPVIVAYTAQDVTHTFMRILARRMP